MFYSLINCWTVQLSDQTYYAQGDLELHCPIVCNKGLQQIVQLQVSLCINSELELNCHTVNNIRCLQTVQHQAILCIYIDLELHSPLLQGYNRQCSSKRLGYSLLAYFMRIIVAEKRLRSLNGNPLYVILLRVQYLSRQLNL